MYLSQIISVDANKSKWSTWKKDGILVIVGLSASVVGAFGPMLSPGFVLIAADLGISVNTLSQSTAWLILTYVPVPSHCIDTLEICTCCICLFISETLTNLPS